MSSEKNNLQVVEDNQFSLFQLANKEHQDYSQSIELYDVLPKYYYGNVKRIENRFLNAIKREFYFRDKKYEIEIKPTTITNAKGEDKAYYPTQREEIVEDAIRKIAIEKGGMLIGDGVGVQFSIYELEKELKKRGHGYNHVQIKEAMNVCFNTAIKITSADGTENWSFHVFGDVGFSEKDKKNKKAFVKFNSLVTRSINQRTFRLFNYKKCMSLKYMLSRWLFKRISHHFLQASVAMPYEIKLTTIIRDSGAARYSKLSDNRIQVRKSLEELKIRNVFTKYDEKVIYDHNRKNKIEDILYSFWLSDEFCKDIKKANYIQKQVVSCGEQGELLDFQNELEIAMQNKIYELPKKYIKNFVNTINDKIEFDEAILALKAAKEIIEEYQEKKKDHIPAALTKTALREKWCPKFSYSNDDDTTLSVNVDHNIDTLEKRDQEKFIKLVSFIKDEFSIATYDSWFRQMHYANDREGGIILSFPTKFIASYVQDNYGDDLTNIVSSIDAKIVGVTIEER